jgi:hypothetical protein
MCTAIRLQRVAALAIRNGEPWPFVEVLALDATFFDKGVGSHTGETDLPGN